MDFDELERLRRRRQPALADAPFPALGRVQTEQEAPASPEPTSGDPVVSFALDLAAGLLVAVLFSFPFSRAVICPLSGAPLRFLSEALWLYVRPSFLCGNQRGLGLWQGYVAPFGLPSSCLLLRSFRSCPSA